MMDVLGEASNRFWGTVSSLWENQEKRKQVAEQNKQNEIAAHKNDVLQREFAQKGIRWRVEDAKAAGISPLAALGASTSSPSPVHMPGEAFSNAGLAADMGQNLSRSIQSTRTADERQLAQLQLESMRADVEGKTLDNQMRLSKLRSMSQVGPAFPGSDNFIPGQGDSGGVVKVKPSERTASQPGRLAQEAGWRPDVSFARTDTGLTPMIPEGLSESLEDDIIGSAMWRYRNSILPNFSGEGHPPTSQLPKGATHWSWHYGKQEWQPAYSGDPRNWADKLSDWYVRRQHHADTRTTFRDQVRRKWGLK